MIWLAIYLMIFSVFIVNTRMERHMQCLDQEAQDEDISKQKFVSGNFYWLEITNIKSQNKEYQKFVEEVKMENIILPKEFLMGIVIEKLLDSWKDYNNNSSIRVNNCHYPI